MEKGFLLACAGAYLVDLIEHNVFPSTPYSVPSNMCMITQLSSQGRYSG